MIDRFRLEELVNALYDQGELMVRVAETAGDQFVLDKSGDVEPELNTRGGFEDRDRRIAAGIFALCGLDFRLDRGSIDWRVVARVYEDELDVFEVTYDLQEFAGSDGVSDHLYDLVRDGDDRLSELRELGPKEEAT